MTLPDDSLHQIHKKINQYLSIKKLKIQEFMSQLAPVEQASDQKIINYFRPLITGVAKEIKTYESATISELQQWKLQTDQLQCTALPDQQF